MDLVRLFVGFATSMLLVSCTPPSIAEPPALLDNQVSTEALNLGSDPGPVFTSSIYLTRVEQSARNAAVKVSDPLEQGHGSGTYLLTYNRYVVITAAHVVEKHSHMWIEGRNGERVLGRVVHREPKTDLAIITVPEMETRKAMTYRPRRKADIVGEHIVYSGFPGKHDLLTIRGTVAGEKDNYIIAHTYGWFGASGSGVFDRHGRLIGTVSALDIGMFYMPHPIEDIIWISPIWHLNSEMAKAHILSDPPPSRSFPGAAAPRRGGTRD